MKYYLLGILGISSLVLLPASAFASTAQIVHIEPMYVANFADDRTLVGASHNVFAAKILQVTGTTSEDGVLRTQFKAEVIYSIKGNLKGEIILNQEGGVANGKAIVFGEDVANTSNYFLQPGSTYILCTRVNGKNKSYTVNPYPTATRLLTSNQSLSSGALASIASSDWRTLELESAYRDEKTFDYDRAHGLDINSFKSLGQQNTASNF